MLSYDHSPLKVEMMDLPCTSEFLQPFIHITVAYLLLLGERKDSFLTKMSLYVIGWGALVRMTLVLDALTTDRTLVEELICALLWK